MSKIITTTQILEAVINKAIDGGWSVVDTSYWYVCPRCEDKTENRNIWRKARQGTKYEFNKYCGFHGEKLVRRKVRNNWFVSNEAVGEGPSFHVSYPDLRPLKGGGSSNGLALPIYELIFNHDFAKALWGDKSISTFPWADDGSFKYETRVEAWMHHLQQMVISEDPINYLRVHAL